MTENLAKENVCYYEIQADRHKFNILQNIYEKENFEFSTSL